MNSLHEQFVVEARELIQQATEDLIALERSGVDDVRIDRVFRAFHTLKGSAGVVELPAMTLALHAAEDLLSAIHDNKLAISQIMIDRALSCLDQVSQWVDHFETQGTIPADAGNTARIVADQIRALLSGAPSAGPTASAEGSVPAWVSDLLARTARPLSGGELWAIEYKPREGCFFDGDDPLGLMRKIPNLQVLTISARETWPPAPEIDPFVCNLQFHALANASHAEIAEIFRMVPDQVRMVSAPTDSLPEATAVNETHDEPALIRSVIEEQLRVLQLASHDGALVGRIGSAGRVAVNALRHGGHSVLADRMATATAESLQSNDSAQLVAALRVGLETLAADNLPASAKATQGDPAGRPVSRSLRVDEARIDALVNLAGELIVAKNGLAHLARRAEMTGDSAFTRDLRREHEDLERLITDMHAAMLQLRMVPVAQLFQAFPRLVRDTSIQLGKKAILVTGGEAAECDKNLVDRLFEPVMHLVRNALDHGIEPPQTRAAARKDETGTITLSAHRSGERLVITVGDDGRGIDPAAIRHAARDRRLMPEEELAALDDEQVLHLIFAAGLSTAGSVSELSGRGVGMDVVRATVEQMGGRVAVRSTVGSGTTMTLDLPVSIAVSRVMVVETSGQAFGIVMDSVVESVRLTPDEIRTFKNNDGFLWRDRVVPICGLDELMGLPPRGAPGQDYRLFIIVESGGGLIALEIDAIRDRLDVVLKPMQGLLAKARSYSGTTVTGDGKVLLVLNVQELLP